MFYKCYLKKETVYLPTTVNQGIARYMDVDPVTVVPVVDTDRPATSHAGYNSQRKPISALQQSRMRASRRSY